MFKRRGLAKKPRALSFGENALGWIYYWVKPLLDADPRLAVHIVEQHPSYLHYLAVLAATVRLPDSPQERKAFAKRLRCTSVKGFLSECRLPAGLKALTRRAGPNLMPEFYYDELLEVAGDQDQIALLQGVAQIKTYHLSALRRLPKVLQTKRVFARLSGDDDVDRLLSSLVVLESVWPELDEQSRALMVIQPRKGADFELDLPRSLLNLSTFPAPPWQGDDLIKPIKSYKELTATARAFSNCLEDYAMDAINGTRAFYMWKGSEPAVFSLHRHGLWWCLGEIRAPKNKYIPQDAENEIKTRLLHVGIACIDPFWVLDIPEFVRRQED